MRRKEDLAFFQDDYPEEVEILMDLLVVKLGWLGVSGWHNLFTLLTEVYIDEGKSRSKLPNTDFYIDIANSVEYSGSGECSPSKASTSVYIKEDGTDKDICEIYYSIGDSPCCDSQLLSFEVIPSEDEVLVPWVVRSFPHVHLEGIETATGVKLDNLASLVGITRKGLEAKEVEELANLSIRSTNVGATVESNMTMPDFSPKGVVGEWERVVCDSDINNVISDLSLTTNNNVAQPLKGENIMGTIKTVNITLFDTNDNVKGGDKIVYRSLSVVTEYSNEETKMNIIATGAVMAALKEYNTKTRMKTVDKVILRSTGVEVFLEPIELLSDPELQWSIVTVA